MLHQSGGRDLAEGAFRTNRQIIRGCEHIRNRRMDQAASSLFETDPATGGCETLSTAQMKHAEKGKGRSDDFEQGDVNATERCQV